jgi:hypothetical protein
VTVLIQTSSELHDLTDAGPAGGSTARLALGRGALCAEALELGTLQPSCSVTETDDLA